MAAICAAELGEWHRRTNEDGPIRPGAVGGNNREFICRPNAKPMRFNLRVYRESVNRDTNRRRFTAGRHRRTMGVIVALIMMTALVAPRASAGVTGAVPFSGDDPASGIRTVTIADITDFHGHIERGADNAMAFDVADSHNPGNLIAVSTGDLVGGSPYESAALDDQPTLDMARAWGLTISAVGNHELDRGVADFNNRVTNPANGIDWLCANVSDANKASSGMPSRVKDYTIREVNGKRIGFVGALTGALGSVATPRITRDADLVGRDVDAINRVSRQLKRSGAVDAVVVLFHSDASNAVAIGGDADLIYTGHAHAVKRLVSRGGAPIIEAGSYGRDMAVQDLTISGSGRQAKVTVRDVDLGNGAEPTRVDGVVRVAGMAAHPRQAAWMSAGGADPGRVARSERIFALAGERTSAIGDATIGSLAPGARYDTSVPGDRPGSLGLLVADANREAIIRRLYAGTRLHVVGFSNGGSLRTQRLDLNADRKISVREVDSLMALQFKTAHETFAVGKLKGVLAQQFWRDNDGKLRRKWLGVSSNVSYRYEDCATSDGRCGLSEQGDSQRQEAVLITDLVIDGVAVRDDDLVIVASNSYLLQGGDGYSGFKAGANYGELDMEYAQPLKDYIRTHSPLGSADDDA